MSLIFILVEFPECYPLFLVITPLKAFIVCSYNTYVITSPADVIILGGGLCEWCFYFNGLSLYSSLQVLVLLFAYVFFFPFCFLGILSLSYCLSLIIIVQTFSGNGYNALILCIILHCKKRAVRLSPSMPPNRMNFDSIKKILPNVHGRK